MQYVTLQYACVLASYKHVAALQQTSLRTTVNCA